MLTFGRAELVLVGGKTPPFDGVGEEPVLAAESLTVASSVPRDVAQPFTALAEQPRADALTSMLGFHPVIALVGPASELSVAHPVGVLDLEHADALVAHEGLKRRAEGPDDPAQLGARKRSWAGRFRVGQIPGEDHLVLARVTGEPRRGQQSLESKVATGTAPPGKTAPMWRLASDVSWSRL